MMERSLDRKVSGWVRPLGFPLQDIGVRGDDE